jgi:hypothetical protein
LERYETKNVILNEVKNLLVILHADNVSIARRSFDFTSFRSG